MITAVDTNVLIDVFTADKTFAEKSADALEKSMEKGKVVACEVVWAETCALFPNDRAFEQAMHELGIQLSPMEESAARQAGGAWRQCPHDCRLYDRRSRTHSMRPAFDARPRLFWRLLQKAVGLRSHASLADF
ncbi:MAG TPA: type II toxin-antitoxin system VapC family toxin [Tichowtungia sp.]|nr:type II toxin-antitoxin system VapC family toxin [Tichowtungia sp.]